MPLLQNARVDGESNREESATMNTYRAFYKGKTLDVKANSQYAAQLEAAKQFRAKKSWEVTVVLCDLNGTPYKHVATE